MYVFKPFRFFAAFMSIVLGVLGLMLLSWQVRVGFDIPDWAPGVLLRGTQADILGMGVLMLVFAYRQTPRWPLGLVWSGIVSMIIGILALIMPYDQFTDRGFAWLTGIAIVDGVILISDTMGKHSGQMPSAR